jgi:hypothetical protein
MRKISKIILVASLLTVSGFAESPVGEFYYEKGYVEGSNDNYYKGYQAGIKEVLKRLENYSKVVEAREAGKYLSSNGMITAPMVFQEKQSDGAVKTIVKGCEMEGKNSMGDVLRKFGSDPFSSNSSAINDSFYSIEKKMGTPTSSSDGVVLAQKEMDTPTAPTATINVPNDMYPAKVVKGSVRRDVIETQNAPFMEDGRYVNIVFNTKDQMNNFCKIYKCVK